MRSSSSDSVELAALRLWKICGLALLLFVLSFLVIYPTREVPSYSTLVWEALPSLNIVERGATLAFVARLSSFEQKKASYLVEYWLNGKKAGGKDVSLSPSGIEFLSFNESVSSLPSSFEVRVKVWKSADAKQPDVNAIPLEVVAWVSN
ncbi:MAG: hypothetical protein V1776_05585 [Candidatus Diapherotrites archaeon]